METQVSNTENVGNFTPSEPSAPKPKKAKAVKVKKVAAPKKQAKVKKVAKVKARKPSSTVGMAILREYAPDYEHPKGKDGKPLKTPNGNPIVDSGDDVARALRGKPLGQVYEVVAKRIKQSVQSLKTKYGRLNPGQQRMNLGNKLRGFMNAKPAK